MCVFHGVINHICHGSLNLNTQFVSHYNVTKLVQINSISLKDYIGFLKIEHTCYLKKFKIYEEIYFKAIFF